MSIYNNAWEKLVAENGLEAAQEIMRQRRKLVKKPGLANVSKARAKEISVQGNLAKAAKKANK